MTDTTFPASGRELAAWLATRTTPPLVTVSGLPRSGKGKPGAFTAILHSWNSAVLTVKPIDGSTPASIPMPAQWMMAGDPRGSMAFGDRGVTIGDSIHITFLDDKDPFK